jgi:hypothetical protein
MGLWYIPCDWYSLLRLGVLGSTCFSYWLLQPQSAAVEISRDRAHFLQGLKQCYANEKKQKQAIQ